MGRASEIATLDERLSYLGRLQGSMLVIEGEAGIGKSRLLTEFIQRANSRRVRNVVTAECSYAVQRPFHPIGRFIGASYAAMSHQTIPASVLRALAQVAPHEMSSVGTFEPKPSVTLERLDLFAALSWYVKSASYNRATIFAIEDLHWADRSTCDFLAYLAAHLLSSRLLIIATYRSDELKESSEPSAGLQRLLQSAFVQRIHLSPLSRKEIAALIRDMPEARVALAPEAVADISERCDGNPFFAEELVKGIESEDGAPTALPVSIRASISRRLNALTPADRRILSYASVLGQRFDPDILARALTCPVEELLPALRRARDANIIVEDDGRRPLCRFRHALTRQTICQDMLAFELRAFHARIVEIIEALENVDTYVGELAYHAFEARDQRRSLLYNERAGESAFAARALAEALVCFKRALSVASDTIDQVRLIERLGTSLRLQGESLPALEHFDSAVKLRLARGEFDDAARLAGLIVAEDNNIGRTKPYAYGERFVGQHGALITAAAREELLLVMAQGAVQTEDVASAQRFIDMLPEPHMLPADRRLTYIRVQLWCNAYAGELDRWKACAIILEDHVLTLPPFAAVTTLCGIAQTATLIGAQAEATRALAHGERIASQWGFHTLRAFLAVLKAMHLYTSGQLVEAKFSVEFALENGEAYLPRANALPLGILIALSLGDEPLAQRCLGERISRFSHEQPTANDSAFLLAAETLWFSSKGKASRSASDLIAKINDTMVTTHLGRSSSMPPRSPYPKTPSYNSRKIAMSRASTRTAPSQGLVCR